MLLVGWESLRPGMKLARPVLHPDRGDLLLLSEGYQLDAAMLGHLKTHGITHAWIQFPGLEEIEGQVSERVARGHIELYQVLNRSIDSLERRVAVRMHVQHYRRAVHQMLSQIIETPDHQVVLEQLTSCGPRLTGHMANCAYLSLLIGAHLAGYLRNQRRSLPPDVAESTAQLGLGALLHDVGKMNMTDEMAGVSILDDRAYLPEYRMHVRAGYQEVRDSVSPVAANVVLHHHQRFDGDGFPEVPRAGRQACEPLSGQRIHVFSRILAAVDVFDHLLCPAGASVPTIVAVHGLRSERFAGWFDPVVVEALLRLVPPFMIGQVVRLSDGQLAVVVANHPESPCRPTVKVLSGPVEDAGTRASAKSLDLRMARTLTIAEAEGVDVRPYLYTGEFEPAATTAA